MKNTFGNNISLTIFGESHGNAIGAVIDGLAPGIPVDEDKIASLLSLRRPAGKISTARREEDKFVIESGVFEGYTTGTPVCILIPNENTNSRDYSATRALARPSHADYTAYEKYHGFEDYRGGGHFSGRITAALVAAAGILIPALEAKGIFIGTRIKSIAGVCDRDFADFTEDIKTVSEKNFPVFSSEIEAEMQKKILEASQEGDSVGGILETAVIGLPRGLGEPWFDTLEGMISHAVFSVPAVKGIEFGAGFGVAEMRGSRANDTMRMENGSVITQSNTNGGIVGGISNGAPLLFRCAVKPTPSIFKEQETVDFIKGENATLSLIGRHDPCIVHRAAVVVRSVVALALADQLATRYGTDWLSGGTKK